MLTVRDIEEYPLPKVLGGYKCEEVDSFLDTVAADYKKLYEENEVLTKKLNLLAEKLTEYRKNEDYLKDAMIEAQRVVADANAQAKEKAEAIVAEANEKGEEVLRNALRKSAEVEKHYEQMRLEVTNFRNQLLNTYKSHIEIISALPVYEMEEEVEEEPVEEEPVAEAPVEAPQEESVEAAAEEPVAEENDMSDLAAAISGMKAEEEK